MFSQSETVFMCVFLELGSVWTTWTDRREERKKSIYRMLLFSFMCKTLWIKQKQAPAGRKCLCNCIQRRDHYYPASTRTTLQVFLESFYRISRSRRLAALNIHRFTCNGVASRGRLSNRFYNTQLTAIWFVFDVDAARHKPVNLHTSCHFNMS